MELMNRIMQRYLKKTSIDQMMKGQDGRRREGHNRGGRSQVHRTDEWGVLICCDDGLALEESM
jgi:hypothetical protein